MAHDSAKNGGIQEPEDNDLDLSEADFAPAHCSTLIKSCAVNGNELDSPAFHTAVSESSFPVRDADDVLDDGGSSISHSNVVSSSIRNAEAITSASFHHDAIGLPLCTEDITSESYEAVTSQNSVVMATLSINSDNHMVKCDLDDDIMRSDGSDMLRVDATTNEGECSALNDSSANAVYPSASDKQVVCGYDKEFDCSLGSDKTDSVEAIYACDGAAIGSIYSLNAVECQNDSAVDPVQQNSESLNWDVSGVGELCGISPPSTDDMSLSAMDEGLMKPETTDEVDNGVDEVDKTVPNLNLQHRPATSVNRRSFEAGAPFHKNDSLSDDNEKPTTVTDSVRVEGEFDETCGFGIDHVERITTDDMFKSRAKVRVDSCSEVGCVDDDSAHVECRSESSDHEVMKEREAVESVSYEAASNDTDAVISSEPVQSVAHGNDHTASSVSCSDFTDDSVTAHVTNTDLLLLADIADGICNVPTADGQNHVDGSESLQQLVDKGTSLSHVAVESADVKDVTLQENVTLSVNDAGNTQDQECQEPSEQSVDKQSVDECGDNLPVYIADDVTVVNTEPCAVNKTTVVEAFSEIQLNSGQPLLEKVDLNCTASAPEPDVHEMDLSKLAKREEEQDKSGLNDNVMPNSGHSELAGHDHNHINDTVSSQLSSVVDVVDNSSLTAETSRSITAGFDSVEKDESHLETTSESTDGRPVEDQQQTDAKRQSDEDAEKWFEEQFAACEDFDVEEFVSSAWSAFHPETADWEPAVGNIYEEMLEQTSAAADNAKPAEIDTADAWQHVMTTGDREPANVETSDAWHHVENAAISVDDSCSPPPDDHSQYLDNEMDTSTCTLSFQPDVPQTVSSTPSNFFINYWIFVHFALLRCFDTVGLVTSSL